MFLNFALQSTMNIVVNCPSWRSCTRLSQENWSRSADNWKLLQKKVPGKNEYSTTNLQWSMVRMVIWSVSVISDSGYMRRNTLFMLQAFIILVLVSVIILQNMVPISFLSIGLHFSSSHWFKSWTGENTENRKLFIGPYDSVVYSHLRYSNHSFENMGVVVLHIERAQ